VAVVGRVAESDGILALCELRRPDVVILDAGQRLGEMAGRVSALVRRFPDLNVIVTYRDASEQEVAAACRAGVSSLVPESRGLVAVLALLRRKKGDHAREARRERGGLTDREHEIVVLTGSGHSVTEIAALLGISPLTVENLKRRVYAKLEVSSGAHAVARAASLGMLERKTPVAAPRRRTTEGGSGVLGVVAGRPGPVLDQVVTVLLESKLPFVLIRRPGPVGDSH
jgi:two-component system, NarL family, nitrate/nitrite response regulator NarL